MKGLKRNNVDITIRCNSWSMKMLKVILTMKLIL